MITIDLNSYTFNVVQYGQGVFHDNMRGHRHSANSYELHYIIGGEGELNTSDKSYRLGKGIFFVTGPGIYHQQTTVKENPLQEIFVYLQGSGKKTNDSLVTAFLNTPFFIGTEAPFEGLFREIVKEQDEKKLGYENVIKGLILQLLVMISRLYLPDRFETGNNSTNLNDRRFLVIEQAFIDNGKGLTLSSLSEQIGLCNRQTERLLKKYYGKSFSEIKKQL